MTDHKGNPIQIGDTISIVATRDDAGRLGWFVMEQVKVIEHVPELFVEVQISNEQVCAHHIDTILKHMDDTDIICIKGKSDSEQEYYQEYFRVT